MSNHVLDIYRDQPKPSTTIYEFIHTFAEDMIACEQNMDSAEAGGDALALNVGKNGKGGKKRNISTSSASTSGVPRSKRVKFEREVTKKSVGGVAADISSIVGSSQGNKEDGDVKKGDAETKASSGPSEDEGTAKQAKHVINLEEEALVKVCHNIQYLLNSFRTDN